ncbi:uncharacterized protein LOC119402744 [Rhipicephalus sanguineus]|uniref:uncharacterized protein LOC119402744 n=1 Tax=Rhipicephalus sanguineus TaxID=34632 RepID=UPI0020C58766|nr:uncharacterized protein LOC119402744 [Rhipicephalus sanguineus]
MDIAVLALLFVLLDPATPKTEPSCNLKGQKEIDWNKLASKRWYAALNELKYAKYKMCNERLIYPKEGRVVSIIIPTEPGAKSWNNTLNEGKLESDRIRFPKYDARIGEMGRVVYYYQIVDTDHNTWAIEHTCGYQGSRFVLLLSEKMQDVPKAVMWQVRRSLRKAGVKDSYPWYGSGCLSGKGSDDYINNLSLVRGH